MVNVIGRDDASAEFFDAAQRGELVTRYCTDCQNWSEPAALSCAACHGSDLQWRRTEGQGAIASWVEIPPGRKAPEGTPTTVVALVELSEGPWVTMSVADSEKPRAGQSVSVEFDQPEGGEPVPVARLR